MAASSYLALVEFQTWACLNDVKFDQVKLQEVEGGKGVGVLMDSKPQVSKAHAQATATKSEFPILSVPRDLILSAEAVGDFAKVDKKFKELLEAVGNQSTRQDVVLYLFCHMRASKPGSAAPTPTPWTEYLRFLPREVPVPTTWTQFEKGLLKGTSLQVALEAKLGALEREFDALRECSQRLPFWNQALWLAPDPATLQDWILADAWYRSRSLELPQSGEAMVPGLDMLNHAHSPTSLYEQDGAGDVVLLPRPGVSLLQDLELTISYGEAKSAAEMLFSYGFIDTFSSTSGMTLPLTRDADDPLSKAKYHIFDGPPTVTLSRASDGSINWHSPFLHLQILNEEDGLDFRLLQGNTSEQELRMFWLGQDVTGRSDQMETLTDGHDMQQIFQLRAVVTLQQLLADHLSDINDGPSLVDLEPLIASDLLRQECATAAFALKTSERSLLADATQTLEGQKLKLLAHPHVAAHLGSTEDAQVELGAACARANENEVDGFS